MPRIGDIVSGKVIGKSYANRHIWMACPICGEERWVQYPNKYGKPSLCVPCYRKYKLLKLPKGDANPMWKGGRNYNDGYIQVRVYEDDFFYPMADSNGYVKEHRLVVAKTLGRCLLPWEVVHHKAGYTRDDNRYPKTLELITDKRFHMIDAAVKAYIRRLEKRIEKLEANSSKHGVKET